MRLIVRAALATAGLVAASGCADGDGGAAARKAGASGTKVTTLRLGTPDSSFVGHPGMKTFLRSVARRSGGRLRVEPVGVGRPEGILEGLRDGRFDLGEGATRAFELDAPALTVLTAPLVVDSHDLVRALFGKGLPDQVLPALRPLGLEGIGLFAGDLVWPFRVRRPLLTRADWRSGVRIALVRNRPRDLALEVLGVDRVIDTRRAGGYYGGAPDEAMTDGTANAMDRGGVTLMFNPSGAYGVSGTLNVTTGARMSVLYARPDRLRRLTDEQRGWLRAAAADGQAASLGRTAEGDAEIIDDVCRNTGLRFALGAGDEVRTMRRELLERYRADSDPGFRRVLDFVEGVRRDVRPDPWVIPPSCRGPVPGQALPVRRNVDPQALDGVYRYRTEPDDYRALGVDAVLAEDLAGDWTVTLRGGRGRIVRRQRTTTGGATPDATLRYRVDGERVTFLHPNGLFTVNWQRDGKGALRFATSLRLDPSVAPDLGTEWRRVR